MPTIPFNSLTTNWNPQAYTQKNDTMMTAIVVTANNMEGSYLIFIPRMNLYERAQIATNDNGYSGTGFYQPIMPGQAVLVRPHEGNSSRWIITNRIDYTPNGAKLFQKGETHCPNNLDEKGRPVSKPVCDQLPDDIKVAGLAANWVGQILFPFGSEQPQQEQQSQGLSQGSRVPLPMDIFPSSNIRHDLEGGLQINAPGDITLTVGGNFNVHTITGPQPLEERKVDDAVKLQGQIEEFLKVNAALQIDWSGPRFTKIDKTFAVGLVGSTPAHDEYVEQVKEQTEMMVEQAEEEAEEIRDFEDICVAALTAALNGDWGALFDLAVDFAKKEVLPKLNEALPDFLQMNFDEDGNFSIGPMGIGEDGQISFDEGQAFSMAQKGLDEINQFLPDFLQLNVGEGQLNFGNLATLGLGGLEGTTDLNGVEITKSNAPGGFDVKWGNVISAGVNFGLGELNKHLPADAQVSVAECGEGETTPYAIDSAVPEDDDRYCIGAINVGGIAYDTTTGNVKVDPDTGEGALSSFLGGLPPPFSRAARLIFERINLGELFQGNFDEAFAELDLKAIAIQLICGLLSGGEDSGSALPRLVTPTAQGINPGVPRTAQNLYQDFQPTRPHRYVTIANAYPETVPIVTPAGEDSTITYEGLDFSADPAHGLASLLTEYGIDRAGGLVNGLSSFVRDQSIYGLQDVLQNGTTPGLFNAFSAVNAALDREDKPRSVIQSEIDNTIPSTCSGATELKTEIESVDLDKAVAYIVFGMGYPEFKYENWVQDPLTMLDWAALAEPEYTIAMAALKGGDITTFLIELLRLQTGYNLDLYPMGRVNLQAWVDRAYSPSVSGHIYP